MQSALLSSYNQLCELASSCHKVFVKRTELGFEEQLDELLNMMDVVLTTHPQLTGLILNTSNKDMHFIALFILKHACFCRSLCINSKVVTEHGNSIIKASLLLLYVVLPEFIATKKDHKQLSKFKKALSHCPQASFQLAKRIPLADNNSLKLLSQLSNVNTYSKANSKIQLLAVTALNCSITAFSGLKGKVTYNSALSRLLAIQDDLHLIQPNLQTYKTEFSLLCKSSVDFNGALVRLKNQNLAYILSQSPDKQICSGFEFGQTSIDENVECSEIDTNNVRSVLPHQTLDHNKIIRLILNQQALEQTNAKSKAKPKATESHVGIYRYSANHSWKVISQSVLRDNNKVLGKVLLNYPDQSQLLLNFATMHNRKQLQVTDVSHAIAMLGKVQLFPTLCNDNIKVKQHSVKQMGSDVVNYKIDLFSHILSQLHHQTLNGLPKYHELIGRILMIALMTIPKVAYAASTPACLVKANENDVKSLAEIFGLNTFDNWKKISLILSKSWLLPEAYIQVIEQYFNFLDINKDKANEHKNININTLFIIIATYFFQHFINGENKLPPNKTIKNLMSEFKSKVPNLENLYLTIGQTTTIFTPLS